MAGEGQNQGGAGTGQNQGDGKPAGSEGAGNDAKAYLQYFPEAIRSEKTLEKFSGKDVNEVLGKVATSYVNLEKHAGGAIRVPGEKATKEEIAAFREKLGVPKDADGYEIKEIKVGEAMLADEADTKKFLAWAHEQGLTKAQTRAVVDRFVQHTQAAVDAAKQDGALSAESAYSEMQKEWGPLTDRNVALVQRGVKEFFGEEFAGWLEETGAGNDPRFLRGALRTFQPMMEDGLIKGENLGMKTADAQTEIKRLMASEEYQGKKGRDAQVAAVEQIRALSALAYASAE